MNKSGYSKLFIKTVLLSVFLSSGYSISSVYADVRTSGNIKDISAEVKKQITGTVLDKDGEPVIGANVVEKGTTNGTITGIDGTFSLSVSENSTLNISYIGYLPEEVKVGSKNQLSIQLKEDTQALDEVIVIGYGTAKRKDFTGSVTSVKLENSPVALATNLNALESLKGNVSGLDIGFTNSAGGTPTMQVRGQNSISGSNDPLIVVDGVIFMGNVNEINPNDIASYDVLKDATSAAANGYSDHSFLTPQEELNMKSGNETKWLDEISRTGWIQDYQAAISGAGEKMNYYLSAAYTKNEGIIKGDDFDRVSVLAKVNTDITSWLQIGLDAAYTRSDYSGLAAGVGSATILSPYGMMYRPNGLLEATPDGTRGHGNPLWGIYDEAKKENVDYRDNLRANAYAVIKCPWISGLSYRFNFAGNLNYRKAGDFSHESSQK